MRTSVDYPVDVNQCQRSLVVTFGHSGSGKFYAATVRESLRALDLAR